VLRGELIDELGAAEQIRDEWDALAVSRGRPFCSPAWMLAWWKHAAPRSAILRIAVVRQNGRLVGVAPFFAREEGMGLVRYRLLATGTSSHIEPLARPGTESDVGKMIGELLSGAAPPVHGISLEGIPSDSRWAVLIRGSWPTRSRPRSYRRPPMPVPTLTLTGRSYEQWLSGISPHLRREIRRRRRRLEERGALFHLAESPETAIQGLRSFAALHYGRWGWRGGSGALNPRIELMLADVARDLVTDQRFRLWSIEVEGVTISSQVFIGAGGELAYWLGGFDEEWAAYGPSIQAVRAAIEHAWTCGDNRVNFGPGGQDYKYGFADGQDLVESVDVLPPSFRYPIAWLRLVPEHLRARMSHVRHETIMRLSPHTRQRLKRAITLVRKRS
jgi:CelD/BcsL family acetyltransferase involved in cellulose biosynthesis